MIAGTRDACPYRLSVLQRRCRWIAIAGTRDACPYRSTYCLLLLTSHLIDAAGCRVSNARSFTGRRGFQPRQSFYNGIVVGVRLRASEDACPYRSTYYLLLLTSHFIDAARCRVSNARRLTGRRGFQPRQSFYNGNGVGVRLRASEDARPYQSTYYLLLLTSRLIDAARCRVSHARRFTGRRGFQPRQSLNNGDFVGARLRASGDARRKRWSFS